MSADRPGDARACVVAVRPETFEACLDGVYPCPPDYPRATADLDCLAFYRTAPVSAVTHCARVRGRHVEDRGDGGRLAGRWGTLPDRLDGTATVFELGPPVRLADPVKYDGTPVRGAWYCTVDDLRAAGTTGALAVRTETR